MTRRKKTSITVGRDDFEEQLRREFDFVAQAHNIPRGKLLSRAMYLACKELVGDRSMKSHVDVMKRIAHTKGTTFDEQVVLDTDQWKLSFPFFQELQALDWHTREHE